VVASLFMPPESPQRPSSPGVRFPPPLLFVGPFFLAFLLDQRIEFLIVGAGAGPIQVTIGTVMFVAGLGLMFWGIVSFWHVRTSILPFRPARTLVIVRPYTFTRNPMYLGMTVAYLGGAIATNWAWPLVFLPFVLMAVSSFVIAREERYLRAAFGEQYEGYCARVRRWI
jgi:protein-S-isoprenylcysteine O-methyltransferase Ste14